MKYKSLLLVGVILVSALLMGFQISSFQGGECEGSG